MTWYLSLWNHTELFGCLRKLSVLHLIVIIFSKKKNQTWKWFLFYKAEYNWKVEGQKGLTSPFLQWRGEEEWHLLGFRLIHTSSQGKITSFLFYVTGPLCIKTLLKPVWILSAVWICVSESTDLFSKNCPWSNLAEFCFYSTPASQVLVSYWKLSPMPVLVQEWERC